MGIGRMVDGTRRCGSLIRGDRRRVSAGRNDGSRAAKGLFQRLGNLRFTGCAIMPPRPLCGPHTRGQAVEYGRRSGCRYAWLPCKFLKSVYLRTMDRITISN